MVKDISDIKICLFGCGAVAKTTLYYIDNYLKIDYDNLYIYDLLDYKDHPTVKNALDKGASYYILDLNKKENLKRIFKRLHAKDLIIDLTCRTDSITFIRECKKKNIHYINTSLEVDKTINQEKKHEDFDQSYQCAHNEIYETNKTYPENKATQIIEFGMNPGLINCLFKLGLDFMAKNEKNKSKELRDATKIKDYAKMAELLGVDTIHCSENDSTVFTTKPKDMNKQYNTWCLSGCLDELSAFSEFGYGTNEKTMPKDSKLLYENIIQIEKPARDNFCESYVPKVGKIVGLILSHGEGISMSSYLKTATHCPTIHYVYKIPTMCYNSFKNINFWGETPPNPHVVNNYEDDITGIDSVGGLLLRKKGKSVWAGSICDNTLDDMNSGTLTQVAGGVLSALVCMFDEPNQGVIFAEKLDHDKIINLAKPLIGEYFCGFVPYKPKSIQFNDLQTTKKKFDEQYKKKK